MHKTSLNTELNWGKIAPEYTERSSKKVRLIAQDVL